MTKTPYHRYTELKPCPFCGGEATVAQGQIGTARALAWYIECPDCGACSDMKYSFEETKNLWNFRKS